MAKPETIQLLVVCLILATAVIGGWYVVAQKQTQDPMQDRHIMKRGMQKPVLWIFVNNSEVNARGWKDFEARSSRAINLPFLNLCYESCVKANNAEYRIEVIGGLADLALRLGGWEKMPTALKNPEALINEPELNWIRAAVLSKFGGLWASPALIWLKPMGNLSNKNVVLFGTDDEVSFVGPGGTGAPSLRVAWSPMPEHPVWVAWAEKALTRLNKRAGGSEFRRDEMSDAVDAQRQAIARGEPIEIRPMTELSRKGAAGRRIQCEDLLASGDVADIPFELTSDAVYVPIPWPELKERRAFGWFLRMSEDQIMGSNLTVSHLFRGVL
jgi:hypothetical protein